MKTVILSPLLQPLQRNMTIPGSKSVTNRALILSAFADGESTVSGILASDDCEACLDVISNLGADVSLNGDTAKVRGFGRNPLPKKYDLYFRSSGTLARFLPGILAAIDGAEFNLNASEQLKKRPLLPLLTALRQMGAEIIGDSFPLSVRGRHLNGGKVSISVAQSSQYASGLLMCAPFCRNYTDIIVKDAVLEEENYITMTYEMMRDFGADITRIPEGFRTAPLDAYSARDYVIEADFNTALYFLTLAAITKSVITVVNLKKNTVQPGIDFLHILEKIGAYVEITDRYIRVAGTDDLKGGFSVDMRKMSESALTLAAIAPFLDKPVTMTNLSHIRGHECDRITAMAKNLKLLGIMCDEYPDGIKIYPGEVNGGVSLETFNDHRVAMSFALSLLKGKGGMITNSDCVNKTCPNYFSMLHDIGCGISCMDKQ